MRRYADFQTITRSDTRDPATRSAQEIATRAVGLLEKSEAGRRAVRLLGVSVHGFHEKAEPQTADPRDQLGFPTEA